MEDQKEVILQEITVSPELKVLVTNHDVRVISEPDSYACTAYLREEDVFPLAIALLKAVNVG